jgi:fructosamine-3-kinase
MFSQNHNEFFASILFANFGYDVPIKSYEFVSGGCINTAAKLITNQGNFFIKWNSANLAEMFEAEAKGLAILRKTAEIAVPEVIAYGQSGDKTYLLLEFIESGYSGKNFWEGFGQSLAHLHQHSQSYFGLEFNNFIGSLAQNNEPNTDGLQFFIERRLKAQAGLAMYNHLISRDLYDKFLLFFDKIPQLIPSEKPALLHGDLWSGNFMIGQNGQAHLIDPALYYGFREAELAFTHLFGGFDDLFYSAYQHTFPLSKGFEQRIEIYNLYPLLVHVNLFGQGYLSGVERVIKKYVG